MRNVILVLLAVSGWAMAGAAPALAQGYPSRDYPYCLRGDITGGALDCAYTSFRQCMATASGLYAFCYENPMFSRAQYPRPYPVRKHRRHDY